MTTFNLPTAVSIAYTLDNTLATLPMVQLEGLSLKVIRHKFREWFEATVKKLMVTENEQDKKSLLGSAVDYRTRAAVWTLKKERNLEFDEEFVANFRYAIMNVLRDEAFARSNPDERFASPHVVKGREDEQQVLVFRAMDEIDDITKSYSPVYRGSKFSEANQSQYANDAKELIAPEVEGEVDRLLRLARLNIGHGETPAEQLQTLQRAHELLTTHKVWNDILKTPADHLDRLKLALSLESQLAAAQSDRVKAHQYQIAGDDVVVPRIAPHSVPGVDKVERLYQRTFCFVITEGWDFVESGYVYARSFDDARAAVLAQHVPQDEFTADEGQRREVHLA
ncbi:hypothetical protein [Deinococcus multiflagellatus]|uniref:Uncharacterized protein n=1 Tax=Deinococcus multiflagellatus TaxID=1656887 RepID=A0ABW1ZS92_9DEIO|nr:hypothetical protein [Deinococcus multiflagellatus]MBZ9714961.1 hypothetical protein [Deinococcus multiflagellatus]